jgi:hypothetical protein
VSVSKSDSTLLSFATISTNNSLRATHLVLGDRLTSKRVGWLKSLESYLL